MSRETMLLFIFLLNVKVIIVPLIIIIRYMKYVYISAGKIFSREEISKITNLTQERSIDVLVTRLRQKIEPDPKNPKYLQTVRGTGYVLWLD